MSECLGGLRKIGKRVLIFDFVLYFNRDFMDFNELRFKEVEIIFIRVYRVVERFYFVFFLVCFGSMFFFLGLVRKI